MKRRKRKTLKNIAEHNYQYNNQASVNFFGTENGKLNQKQLEDFRFFDFNQNHSEVDEVTTEKFWLNFTEYESID